MSDFLSGFSRPILFLKATTKKQTWIPQYVKNDGTVVAGHFAMVHFADDHDDHKVASGQGTHSQKKAHAALSKVPGFHDLPVPHKAAIIQHHATEIQDAASAAAVLSTFKKKILAGEKPTNAEWKAYDAAPSDKKDAIADEAHGAGKVSDLVSGYWAWKDGAAAPQKNHAQADHLGVPPAFKEPAAQALADHMADPAVMGYSNKEFAQEWLKHNPGKEKELAAALTDKKLYHVAVQLGLPVEHAPAAEPTTPAGNPIPTQADGKPVKPGVTGSLSAKSAVDEIEAALEKGHINAVTKIKQTLPKSDKVKWQKVHAYADAAIAYLDAHPELTPAGKNAGAAKPDTSAFDEAKAKWHAQMVANGTPSVSAGEDEYFVLNTGVTNEKGEVFAHLAHKQHGSLQANGFNPKQTTGWIDPALIKKPAGAGAAEGPKEGDTKSENGKTYVLHNGKWHLDAFGVSAWSYMKESSVPGAPSVKESAQAWLDHNPGKAAELASSLVDLGHLHTAKEMGIYSPPGAPNPAAAPSVDASAKQAHLDKILAAKLPDSNSNAKVENPKLQALHDALAAGDANKILHMGFGSNTYQKKAVGLANEALALLGSPHQVSVSQKMGAHPALNGGAAPAAASDIKPAAPKVVAAAAKPAKPAKAAPVGLSDSEIPTVPPSLAAGYKKKCQGAVKMAKEGDVTGLQTLALNSASWNAPKTKAYIQGLLDQLKAKQAGAPLAAIPVGLAAQEMPALYPGVNKTKAAKAQDLAAAGDLDGLKAYHKLLDEKMSFPTSAAYVKKVVDALEAKHGKAPAVESAWSYDANDQGWSGYPTLTGKTADGNVVAVVKHELGYQVNHLTSDYDEIDHWDFDSLSEAVAKVDALNGPAFGAAALKQIESEPVGEGAGGGFPPGHPDAGPKDGDTKEGADGTLVFHDGRWHKQKKAEPAQVMAQHFTNTTPGHNKFWTVSVHGSKLVTVFGKNGTMGTQNVKEFPSVAAAVDAKNKLINEKLKKGYVAAGHSMVSSIDGGAAPAAKPAPKVVAAGPIPANVDANAPESIDGWTKTAGQKGYNEGGFYTDPSGQAWYCKFPAGGEKNVKNELLANKLAELAGLNVPSLKMVKQGGKVGLASKIIAGAKENKAALLEGKAKGLLNSFAVHAWLANWDAVGNNPSKGFDNILIDGAGVAHHIDQGGALEYGGAGGKKQTFTNEVIELKTMLDPSKNANTAAVFGKMGKADIAASVAKVAAIPDGVILDFALKYGPGDLAARQALGAKLVARKAHMLAQFPQAAKAEPKDPNAPQDLSWVKLKPGEKIVESGTKFGAQFVKIEVPAVGFNAAGIPKPYTYDKSSSKFVNEANTADIKSVYDKAIETHDPAAVLGMKFEQIVKATGEKTGKLISIDEHPSTAYVKEYVNQVAAELDAQTKPTYRVEHRGSFAASYSSAATEIAGKVKALDYAKFSTWKEKAADYLVLDKHAAVGIPSPEPGMFHDVESGSLELAAFKKASDAKYNTLSSAEKSACKAYTGSAYWNWNSAMRLGTVDSADFKAGEPMRKAFHKAAVELPEGIILHRGINVGGDTYKSVIGAVIQDGSFQSCSYGKSAAFSGKQSQLRLHISKGVKAMMATTFSTFQQHEREIILHPNCRYVVMKVETKNGKNVVDVLVLPHED